MFSLTITLTDGTTHTEEVTKMPRNWKSFLMHKLPYGSNTQGCTFTRKAI